jgi:hypothetical protein
VRHHNVVILHSLLQYVLIGLVHVRKRLRSGEFLSKILI